MHVLLTDVLTCPRCGPEYGLILLADRVEERRVLAGALGCANCRARFRVEAGVADLRLPDEPAPASERDDASAEGDALRIAALLGVTEGPALVLVAGPGAAHAGALAELVDGLEVIAVTAQPQAQTTDRVRVSPVVVAGVLPVRSRSLRGVALTGAGAAGLIEEAARAVAPRARVAVINGGDAVAQRLEQCGLRVLASDERATVATRAAL